MKIDKILRVLKIVLVISMLSFVFTYSKYKTNDCHLCSFDVNDEVINLPEFLEVYAGECFDNTIDFLIVNKTGGNNYE